MKIIRILWTALALALIPQLSFAQSAHSPNASQSDPDPNEYPEPNFITDGGIPYRWTIDLDGDTNAFVTGHVGAWSWEDDSLFDASQGEDPVGWTHTSHWAYLRLSQAAWVTIRHEANGRVPWPSAEDTNRVASIKSMRPSFTLWSGYLGTGPDDHTYNNDGAIAWAPGLTYLAHVNNDTAAVVERSIYLEAGDYTLALGSNAASNDSGRQGYRTVVTTSSMRPLMMSPNALMMDPDPNTPTNNNGGIGYRWTINMNADTNACVVRHVGAWSWEDDSLFDAGQGEDPVGWTHTSDWIYLNLTEDAWVTVNHARQADVSWPSAENPDRVASTANMNPSFTLWAGYDGDGGDHHTYNNRGNVTWAEDLTYIAHAENNTRSFVERTFHLTAGQYTLAVGSNAESNDSDRQGYKTTVTTSAQRPFVASANASQSDRDADAGVPYRWTVELDGNDQGWITGHVGAWSWEDDSLFDAGQGEAPVGWTHTSHWTLLRVLRDSWVTIRHARRADVPWPSVQNSSRVASVANMNPSFTLWAGYDGDGADGHTFNNHGDVAWAEDLCYLAHLNNTNNSFVEQTWFLKKGEYTLALGSNASANDSDRQGYETTFRSSTTSPFASSANASQTDPDPNAYPAPDFITDGGIPYQWTVEMHGNDQAFVTGHVGAWSWEDDSLFDASQGEDPVGWTHTSQWVLVRLSEPTYLRVRHQAWPGVSWPSANLPSRVASTANMKPSFTVWSGYRGQGPDDHTFNNDGAVAWAPELTYVAHVNNDNKSFVEATYLLPAGEYTIALGSNATANDTDRQGYRASLSTSTAPPFASSNNASQSDPNPNAYPAPNFITDGGIPYQWTVEMSGNDEAFVTGHVGAWSWEDDSLFDASQGEDPVGWTHTSQWVSLRLTQPTYLTVRHQAWTGVSWPSANDPDRVASTANMNPSFTIWSGYRGQGPDDHTFNNDGAVAWAPELTYVGHVDNDRRSFVEAAYLLPAGDYSIALGSNAASNDTDRQGYRTYLRTSTGRPFLASFNASQSDPAPTNGVPYRWSVEMDADDEAFVTGHVGAWSWEDDRLFEAGQGEPPVGWTHTSHWVLLRLTQPTHLTIRHQVWIGVPWPSETNANRNAAIASMNPSLTIWSGSDNDDGDAHTYNNRGAVAWAEDLTYLDHIDNRNVSVVQKSWSLPAGEYTIALGSNAASNDTDRQGYRAWFRTRTIAPRQELIPARVVNRVLRFTWPRRMRDHILESSADVLFNSPESAMAVGENDEYHDIQLPDTGLRFYRLRQSNP